MERSEIMAGLVSDLDLLKLVVAGDQPAFEQLVSRYQGKVFNLIFRFTWNRQDTEDLAQEVFFKVWKYARTFKGQSAFSTWLYRLTVNVCLNFRQKKKIEPEPLPLLGDLTAKTTSAGEEIMIRERENLLNKALNALPVRQKMAIILANFAGKSYEEIAAIMEISLPAVESLLFRARQKLADFLRPLKKKGDL